jgi:hypothetical protein
MMLCRHNLVCKWRAGAGPVTIREAARRVNRDAKAVHGDVSVTLPVHASAQVAYKRWNEIFTPQYTKPLPLGYFDFVPVTPDAKRQRVGQPRYCAGDNAGALTASFSDRVSLLASNSIKTKGYPFFVISL